MKTQDRLKAELKVLEAINKIIAKKTFGTCQVSFNKGFTVFKFENSLTLKLESLTALEVVRDLISTNENCTEVPTLTFNSLTEEGLYPNSFKVVKLKSLISLMGISRAGQEMYLKLKINHIEMYGLNNIHFTTNPLTNNTTLLSLDTSHFLLQDTESVMPNPTQNPYCEDGVLFRIPFWLKPILSNLPKGFEADIEFITNWGLEVSEYEFKYGFLTFSFSIDQPTLRLHDIKEPTQYFTKDNALLGIIYTEGIIKTIKAFKKSIGIDYRFSPLVKLTFNSEGFTLEYEGIDKGRGIMGNELHVTTLVPYEGSSLKQLWGTTIIVNLEILINQLTIAERLTNGQLYDSPFIYIFGTVFYGGSKPKVALSLADSDSLQEGKYSSFLVGEIIS